MSPRTVAQRPLGSSSAPSAVDKPSTAWEREALDAAIYQPVPQSTAVVDAHNHLRQAIVLFLLPAGTKLPTEPVLAERLGVGVVTMRAALALLRDEGFIVTTRGRSGGSWVAEDDAVVHASEQATRFTLAELHNTIDLLIALETQSMGLAALRATPAERAEIRGRAAYAHERLSPREWQMHANLFHLRVAHATHNPELAAAVRAARARLQELRTAGAGSIVFCVRSGEFHALVADSIVSGDSERARSLCFSYLTSCWDCVLRVIEYRSARGQHTIAAVDGRLAALRHSPVSRTSHVRAQETGHGRL